MSHLAKRNRKTFTRRKPAPSVGPLARDGVSVTAPRLDLRRPARKKPAGNLFRVTGAVSFLTLALFWVVAQLLPESYSDPCPGESAGVACPPLPAVEGGVVSDLQVFLATAGVELAVIAGYLVLAVVRQRTEPGAALRWSPAAVAIVALAVTGFAGILSDDSWSPYFVLWIVTPLVLYDVYRGDPGAVIPVVLGLAPTAVCCALVAFWGDLAMGVLPALMLLVSGAVVVVLSNRRFVR